MKHPTPVLAAVLAVACNSGYVPRTPGHIAVILQEGKPAYVRDGVVYPHTILGGGLRDAVAGNHAAEEAADEFHERMRTGLVVVVAGAVCSSVALAVAIDGGIANDNSRTAVTGSLVALGCSLVMLAGAGYAASAEPYRWDAINMFNDQGPQPQLVPSGPPGASRALPRPTVTLGMH